MRKYLIFFVAVSVLFACSDEAPQDEEPFVVEFDDAGIDSAGVDADSDADADADANLEPEPVFPEVWGAPEIEDENPAADVVEVTLRAEETTVELADGVEVDMYTYNGHVPGPIIQANVGDRVIVNFENHLPEKTTVHWHGLRISDDMDGSPRIQEPVEPGGSFVYDFVVPEAGSYWYHPHVRSNEQVEKGLYGLIVVRDENDPEYDAERYFTIDDILLDNNDEMPGFLESHPEVMHGRAGNMLLTSGQLDPVALDIEQGSVERWRLVNPANARTMSLSIEGASWRVIGTDGGLLSEPYETDRLTLPVGQRFDVEVTFDEAEDARLDTHVMVRDDAGDIVEQAFPLVEVDVTQSSRTPRTIDWPAIEPIAEPSVDRQETIAFDVQQDAIGRTEWTLNGEADPDEPLFTFTEGERVRITLENRAGPEHPFHLHGQFFTVVEDSRPWTHQPGFKDTVLVPGQQSVDIIAYFDNPGQWMAHCHILEHAELGMMSEIVVEPGQ
jgi:FtsP/CotA-like multicopper oxidase with cupredoxin domain